MCGISKGDIFFGFFFVLYIILLFLFERVKGGGEVKVWEMWEFVYKDGVVLLGDF